MTIATATNDQLQEIAEKAAAKIYKYFGDALTEGILSLKADKTDGVDANIPDNLAIGITISILVSCFYSHVQMQLSIAKDNGKNVPTYRIEEMIRSRLRANINMALLNEDHVVFKMLEQLRKEFPIVEGQEYAH